MDYSKNNRGIVASGVKRRLFISVGVTLALLLVGAVAIGCSRFNTVPSLVAMTQLPPTSIEFPEVSTDGVNVTQKQILALLKQEYAAQPAGTKYSQGVEESWCADFASWIMRESEAPLSNPNNGGWRIPGTYTLREYYQSEDRFRAANTGYVPQLGDVVLYDNPSPHGQHTNIVIKNENGLVTTVGGNEGNKIRIQTSRLEDDPGLVGYGLLSVQ